MDNSFPEKLRELLSGNTLPGEAGQWKMAPSGRPRSLKSEKPEGAREAAVCICLYPNRNEWQFPLMVRPSYDGVHSDQVSLPGGKLELGEHYIEAALREFGEETGAEIDPDWVLGSLSPLYIPASNYYVFPVVAFIPSQPDFAPNRYEVEDLFSVGISELTGPACLGVTDIQAGEVVLNGVPCFRFEEKIVWGATAMVLSEFRELLSELK